MSATNSKRTKVVMTLVLFCFVSEFTPYGETAAEEKGVHLSIVWELTLILIQMHPLLRLGGAKSI